MGAPPAPAWRPGEVEKAEEGCLRGSSQPRCPAVRAGSGWAAHRARQGVGKEGGEFPDRAACPDLSGSGAGAGREGRAARPGPPGVLSLGRRGPGREGRSRSRRGGTLLRSTSPPASPERGREAWRGSHPPLPGGRCFPVLSFHSSGCVKPGGLEPRFASWIFLLEPLRKSLNLPGLQPPHPEIYLPALLGRLDKLL